jgi:hypothetical protein
MKAMKVYMFGGPEGTHLEEIPPVQVGADGILGGIESRRWNVIAVVGSGQSPQKNHGTGPLRKNRSHLIVRYFLT